VFKIAITLHFHSDCVRFIKRFYWSHGNQSLIIPVTHLSGESIVIDTMLGTVIIIHPVVNIYFFELIMVSERTICYVDPYLCLSVCSKYQELPGIMQMSGNLKATLIRAG
jgi:hypothetical protein